MHKALGQHSLYVYCLFLHNYYFQSMLVISKLINFQPLQAASKNSRFDAS